MPRLAILAAAGVAASGVMMAVTGGTVWPLLAAPRASALNAAGIAATSATSAARSQLARARADQARASQRADALDRQARTATEASERAVVAAAALGARVEQAEAALAGAEAERDLLRDRRVALDRRLARERAPVARLLAGLQQQIRHPPMLTILQPGSIEDAVHLRATIAALGPQISARTASLRKDVAYSRALERAADDAARQRRGLRADLVARRADLAARSAAEQLRARRASGSADREAERALALSEQARDLATLLRRLDAGGGEAERVTGMAAARGRAARSGAGAIADASAPSPYRLPVAGQLLPQDGAGTRGITVSARSGALVVAPAAGRIAFAGPFRGYGAIVIVEHGGGWISLVTGLAGTQVALGQAVVAGSPLGQAPAGRARIGLELRRDGRTVDALAHLR